MAEQKPKMTSNKMKICDFCSIIPPMPAEWAYDCSKELFDTESNVKMAMTWGACGACSKLIEDHDFKGLVERALESYLNHYHLRAGEVRTPIQIKNHIYSLYAKFWNHKQPKRRPFNA